MQPLKMAFLFQDNALKTHQSCSDIRGWCPLYGRPLSAFQPLSSFSLAIKPLIFNAVVGGRVRVYCFQFGLLNFFLFFLFCFPWMFSEFCSWVFCCISEDILACGPASSCFRWFIHLSKLLWTSRVSEPRASLLYFFFPMLFFAPSSPAFLPSLPASSLLPPSPLPISIF